MSDVPTTTLLARAAWSRVAEPGDQVAGALIAALGPVDALAWLREVAPHAAQGPSASLRLPGADLHAQRRLAVAVTRWAPRLGSLDAGRDLEHLDRLGGRLLVPEAAAWPTRLDDLGPAAPPALWVRGARDLGALVARSVAVIGARACTAYGEHVTAELAGGLVGRGWSVVSGGAYGIDAAAHRAALAVGGLTVAVLAGGIDRPYPAGNARLLQAVLDGGGSVVCEVPPGSVPSKVRFLQRNRLIAALSGATVVVEAAWRSGALNTAGHAVGLLRPLGAVPGPVTSAASAGCHRLLRDGSAVCVSDADEVCDLAGGVGQDLAGVPESVDRPGDGLSEEGRRTLDALPVRRASDVDSITRAAGLSVAETRAALGALELGGLAVQDGGGWRRSSQARPGSGQIGTSRS